jgi:hypothetical protein
MTDSNIAQLVPGPSDAERAEEIRTAMRPHLEALAQIMTRASRDGMQANWNMAADQTGRWSLQQITVVKPL